jgi:hypothetical protein
MILHAQNATMCGCLRWDPQAYQSPLHTLYAEIMYLVRCVAMHIHFWMVAMTTHNDDTIAARVTEPNSKDVP